MTPEERELVTGSIAALWSFQGIFMSRLLKALRDEGALSEERVEALLQDMDWATDIIGSEDGKSYASGLLATVRTLLKQN